MRMLLIGGDNISTIENKLSELGIEEIAHITGRKKGHSKIKIPDKTDLILVLTDYINHNITEIVKRECKKRDIFIIFSKNSWSNIYENIKRYISFDNICSERV